MIIPSVDKYVCDHARECMLKMCFLKHRMYFTHRLDFECDELGKLVSVIKVKKIKKGAVKNVKRSSV